MQNTPQINQTNLPISKKPEPLSSVINKGIYAGRFYFPQLIPFSFLHSLFSNIPAAFYTYHAAQTKVSAEAVKDGTDQVVQLSSTVQFTGFLLSIICFSIVMIVYAAMIYRLNYVLENKNDIGFEPSLKFGGSKILSLWGFTLLYGFFIAIIAILFALIPAFLLSYTQNPIFKALIGLAIIIPTVYLVVKLFYGLFNIVLRNQSVIQSLKRSWELTTGHWWKTAFIILVLSLFIGAISQLIVTPFTQNIILTFAITIIFQTFIQPFMAGIFLAYFYDLEARKGELPTEKSVII